MPVFAKRSCNRKSQVEALTQAVVSAAGGGDSAQLMACVPPPVGGLGHEHRLAWQ